MRMSKDEFISLFIFIITISLFLLVSPQAISAESPDCPTPPDNIYVYLYLHYPGTGPYYIYPDFENDYVVGVLEGEMAPVGWVDQWDARALKAGAVAIRTWGSYKCHNHTFTGTPYGTIEGVSDTGGPPYYDQEYWPGHSGDAARYSQIATDTHGIYMTYNSTLIDAEYSKEAGDPTVQGNSSYLLSVPDPVCVGETREGNGWGLCQYGSQRWATGEDDTAEDIYHPQWEHYEQILTHYYTGIQIQSSSEVLTPPDRWVPLRVDFGATGADPPQMQFGNSYPVDVVAQNTGTGAWNSTSCCLSYYWEGPGGTYQGTSQVCLGSGQSVPSGETHPFNALSITPPSGAPDGAYTLIIAMKGDDGQFLSEQESKFDNYSLDFCTLKTDIPGSPDEAFSAPCGRPGAIPDLPHLGSSRRANHSLSAGCLSTRKWPE